MVTAENVQTIVRAIFKNRFPAIKVAGVDVRINSDEGNNRIIEIKVILELPKDFDPAQLSVVPRETLTKFTEAHDPGFPIMSFIKKSEWREMQAEAH